MKKIKTFSTISPSSVPPALFRFLVVFGSTDFNACARNASKSSSSSSLSTAGFDCSCSASNEASCSI